jgi:hypothetical protein
MPNYAVVSGNTVTNIIVADTKEIAKEATNATCVEYTVNNPASIGWVYDEVSETFTNPEALAEVQPEE